MKCHGNQKWSFFGSHQQFTPVKFCFASVNKCNKLEQLVSSSQSIKMCIPLFASMHSTNIIYNNSQNLDLASAPFLTIFGLSFPAESIGVSCAKERMSYFAPLWHTTPPIWVIASSLLVSMVDPTASSHESFKVVCKLFHRNHFVLKSILQCPHIMSPHCILKRFFNFTTSLHSSLLRSSCINQ